MSKKREPIITLQMPMSAVLIAEVLQGVAYVYPHASMVALHCSGTHCDDA